MTAGPSAPPLAPGPTLGGYARFLRRHRRLVAVLALVGAVIGAGVAVARPAVYAAQAKVALAAVPTGATTDPNKPQLVSVDSDAQVMMSATVLARAAEASGFPGGGSALAASLRISAVPNARVLVVRVTDPDRARALAACGAVVAEFLRSVGATEQARLDATVATLTAQLTDVRDQIAVLAAGGYAGADLAAAGPELLAQLTTLQEELRQVTVVGPAVPGAAIGPPAAPARGSRPLAAGSVVAGLLLGLMAGTAAAAIGDSWRGTGAASRLQGAARVARS